MMYLNQETYILQKYILKEYTSEKFEINFENT